MGLGDDLRSEVGKIFRERWIVREGRQVPEDDDLKLSNDAIHFAEATVLYADLSGSTNMVDTQPWQLAAEVYKTSLVCAARVVRSNGGVITAYDGDRIMPVYVGNARNTDAAKTVLQVNYCAGKIITKAVYDRLNDSAKIGSGGQNMWERTIWTGTVVYRSKWWWEV